VPRTTAAAYPPHLDLARHQCSRTRTSRLCLGGRLPDLLSLSFARPSPGQLIASAQGVLGSVLLPPKKTNDHVFIITLHQRMSSPPNQRPVMTQTNRPRANTSHDTEVPLSLATFVSKVDFSHASSRVAHSALARRPARRFVDLTVTSLSSGCYFACRLTCLWLRRTRALDRTVVDSLVLSSEECWLPSHIASRRIYSCATAPRRRR